MDVRSLLQDVLSEISSKVISFQRELHPIISWVESSGLFQDYRIFEDMHHGITIFALNSNYSLTTCRCIRSADLRVTFRSS